MANNGRINGFTMADRRARTLDLARNPERFVAERQRIFEQMSMRGDFEKEVKMAGYDPWMWEAIAACLISADIIKRRVL